MRGSRRLLELMKRLAAVVDMGSVSGAAEALHVTQPAVTKSIQQLESHFGLPLLYRSRKGTVPTSSGKIVYRLAKQMEKSINNVEAEISAGREVERRRVSIGAGLLWCYRYLPDIALSIGDKLPELDLTLVAKPPQELDRMVSEGRLDIGIGQLPEKRTAGLVYEELLTSQGAIFCHTTHPLQTIELPDRSHLGNFPWITVTVEDRNAIMEMAGELFHPTVKTDNLMLASLIMQSGRHMMWLPKHLEHIMRKFGIERLRVGRAGPKFVSGVFYLDSVALRSSAHEVIKEIRALNFLDSEM